MHNAQDPPACSSRGDEERSRTFFLFLQTTAGEVRPKVPWENARQSSRTRKKKWKLLNWNASQARTKPWFFFFFQKPHECQPVTRSKQTLFLLWKEKSGKASPRLGFARTHTDADRGPFSQTHPQREKVTESVIWHAKNIEWRGMWGKMHKSASTLSLKTVVLWSGIAQESYTPLLHHLWSTGCKLGWLWTVCYCLFAKFFLIKF